MLAFSRARLRATLCASSKMSSRRSLAAPWSSPTTA